MKFVLLIGALLFVSCAGQVVSVPVSTQGRDRDGNVTRGVKSVPLFKNTGNMANANFAYQGQYGTIAFSADVIDNATATDALHKGIQGDIRAGGSVIGTALAGMTGLAVAHGATAGTVATTRAGVATTNSDNVTKVALGQQATTVQLAKIAKP